MGFDKHFVASVGQRLDACGSDAYTGFVVFNLFRNADDHGMKTPSCSLRIADDFAGSWNSMVPESSRRNVISLGEGPDPARRHTTGIQLHTSYGAYRFQCV